MSPTVKATLFMATTVLLCAAISSAERSQQESLPAVQLTKHHKAAVPKEYYVDVASGSDDNPGTLISPFKTLTHARDSIRVLKNASGLPPGGVTVNVRSGEYNFTGSPLSLEEQDSGTEGAPIIYRSYPDDPIAAHLLAGVPVTIDETEPVSDSSVLQLIPRHVRDSIVQIDLKKLGITDYGQLGSGHLGDCANNKLELYFPNRTMVLARYPNISPDGVWQFMEIVHVVDPQKSFQYNSIPQWKDTSTLWLHGFWSFDWADNYVGVASVNTTASTFTVDSKTPPVYGFKAKARYYALNLLEELDTQDEYYVDRNAGIMYLFKPSAGEKGCVSVGETVVTMSTVSHVQLDGFAIGCSRLTAVSASDVTQVQLTRLMVGANGGHSISLTGSGNTVSNVTIFENGCGGISMSGGDQASLTRGNNLLTSSEIHHWSRWKRTYQPGISWSGVGNNFTRNSLHDAPHAGILGGGNDCLFEYNSLSNLCYEVTDSGAFYSGRSWIDRGNIIRNSVFRDIQMTEKTSLGSPSVQAIYLDDQMSGYEIYNNIFVNCHVGSFIGGGRRNRVFNNTYLNCSTAVHVDDRGLNWQNDDCKVGGMFDQQLQSVHYQSPPWSTHYPQLVGIFKDHPCVPVYNVVANNTYCGGNFIDISMGQAKTWLDTVANNSVKC